MERFMKISRLLCINCRFSAEPAICKILMSHLSNVLLSFIIPGDAENEYQGHNKGVNNV